MTHVVLAGRGYVEEVVVGGEALDPMTRRAIAYVVLSSLECAWIPNLSSLFFLFA